MKEITTKLKELEIEIKNRGLSKNGKTKVISFFAKRARGEMCNFIVKNKIKTIEQIKEFNRNDYTFSENDSSNSSIVFVR